MPPPPPPVAMAPDGVLLLWLWGGQCDEPTGYKGRWGPLVNEVVLPNSEVCRRAERVPPVPSEEDPSFSREGGVAAVDRVLLSAAAPQMLFPLIDSAAPPPPPPPLLPYCAGSRTRLLEEEDTVPYLYAAPLAVVGKNGTVLALATGGCSADVEGVPNDVAAEISCWSCCWCKVLEAVKVVAAEEEDSTRWRG